MPLIRRSSPLVGRVAVLLLAATAVLVAEPASAAPEDDLAAAQKRAKQVAAELAEAQEQLAHAQDAVANTQTRVTRIDGRVAAVREQVRQLAVRMYVGGTSRLNRLLRMQDANTMVLAEQFSNVIAGVSTDSLRQYRVDREVLREELEVLEQRKEDHADALGTLRQRQSAAIAEITRLSEVVEQARAAEAAQRAAQARTATSARSSSGTAAPPPGAAPPAPTSESPTSEASSAPSPARRAAPETPSAGAAEWVCPVQGPLAFSNDYGAPRGGGYSHMGNDILAPKGTPVVANVSGVVTHRNGAVSGLAYFLAGDDGNRYFGAHLDSFGASGRVSAGTVIGTVGNTGDAAGGPPHLHFEMHPGGSGYTNPYPMLTKYC